MDNRYDARVAKGTVIPAGRDHFFCPKCGKKYRFKPSLVNQPLQCGCGGKFSVSLPQDVPLAFELDPAQRPAAEYEKPKVYQGSPEPTDNIGRDIGLGVIVPGVLLVIGLAGRVVLLGMAAQKHELKLPVVAVVGTMELILSTAAVLAALVVMGMVLSTEFIDSIGKIVFKVVAVVAFAGAAGLAVSSMGRGAHAWMAVTVALGLMAVLNLILLPWLLKLELNEAPLIIAAAIVLQTIVMFAIAQAVGPRLAGAVMFGVT